MHRREFISTCLLSGLAAACNRPEIENFVKSSSRSDVFLTLDKQIQDAAAENIVNPISRAIGKGLPSDTDLAFISMANNSGNVLAYLPTLRKSAEFDNVRNGQRDIASIAKVFVYLIALQSGAISAEDRFIDEPKIFRRLDRHGVYSVRNYGNSYARRPLTLTEAISRSSNVIAVEVYHKTSQATLEAFLKKLDISVDRDRNLFPIGRYVLPLVTLTSRLTAVPRLGSFVYPRFIDEIRNTTNSSQPPIKTSQQIFQAETCQTVSRALREFLSSGTGTRAKDISARVRGKTGTSTDSIAVLMSREITSTLWIGRRDSNLDIKKSGGTLALPLLADFYRSLIKDRPELVPIWG